MSEPGWDARVSITAQERTHPAIRKLARACIALARWSGGSVSRASARPDGQLPDSLPTGEERSHG